MVDLRVATTTGEEAVFKETDVENIKSDLRGEMLRPSDDSYDDARKIWNGMIDKKPALIVRCAGVADVISAVKFSNSHNLLVAVRGGGHSFAGHSVCDGGLLIDLSPMKAVRVDPVHRTARAEGGVKWGEFDRETQAFGLAITGGQVSDTGIAGLTLGGGLGWLMRKHGLTSDNLLSVDIITADGRFLTASADENADLFWGVRGGGGNFGVVTSFKYQLYPLGQVLGGMVLHPMEKAQDVFKFYQEFTTTAPDELTSAAVLLHSPEGAPAAGIAVCYSGPLEQGEEVLRPLREFGPPMSDMIGPMPYTALQMMLDQAALPGRRYYATADFLTGLGEDAIHTLVEHFAAVPSPYSVVLVIRLGGAVSRLPKGETAFFHRDAAYHLDIISAWLDPIDDQKHSRWTRELSGACKPFASGGVYVNSLGEEGEDRVREAYGTDTYERLVTLKKKYDPRNLFRLNQNIKPTA